MHTLRERTKKKEMCKQICGENEFVKKELYYKLLTESVDVLLKNDPFTIIALFKFVNTIRCFIDYNLKNIR
jgi:hypothetical protein